LRLVDRADDRVVESSSPEGVQPVNRVALCGAIGRKRRRNLDLGTDGEDHGFVLGAELGEKRLGSGLGQRQPGTGHAEAAIDSDRNR
jgi:hypothetical protein